MAIQDDLDLLNMDPSAAPEALRRRFLNICRVEHPDLGGDSEEFLKIKEAWRRVFEWLKTRQCPGCDGTGKEGLFVCKRCCGRKVA